MLLSLTTKFEVFTVVVVPLTVRSLVTVRLPATVVKLVAPAPKVTSTMLSPLPSPVITLPSIAPEADANAQTLIAIFPSSLPSLAAETDVVIFPKGCCS